MVQPDAGHPIIVRKLDTLGSESSLNRHQLRETGGHLTALNLLHCSNRYDRLFGRSRAVQAETLAQP
jgi:hypothetical protein